MGNTIQKWKKVKPEAVELFILDLLTGDDRELADRIVLLQTQPNKSRRVIGARNNESIRKCIARFLESAGIKVMT